MNAKERILYCSILQNMRSQIDTLMEVIGTDYETSVYRKPENPSSPFLSSEDEDRLASAMGLEKINAEQSAADEAAVQAHFDEMRKAREDMGEMTVSMEPKHAALLGNPEIIPSTPNLDIYRDFHKLSANPDRNMAYAADGSPLMQRQIKSINLADELLGFKGT